MKSYFTLLNLLLISVAMYFGVNAFYKIAVAQIDHVHPPISSDKELSASDKKDIRRPLAYYKPIAERNLFRTKEKLKEEPKKKEVKKEEPLKLTDLNLRLWGTIAGSGDQDYAVIQEGRKREQNLYTIGDTVQSAIIKKIAREQVVLNVNGNEEILKLEELSRKKRRAARKKRAVKRQRKPRTQNIRIKRSQIEKAVSNLNNLMKQARIKPHFRNGRPDGITLTRVRRRSIFRKLGLRSGDIITGIDGEEIESVDDALKFYDSLMSESDIKLEIKRRGRPRVINYKIM